MGAAPSSVLKRKNRNPKFDTLAMFWNFVSVGDAQNVLKAVTDDPTLHGEKNQNGENAVHVAINAGFKEVVRVLVETNPSTLEQTNNSGSGKYQTLPLQQAIKNQKKEIVSLLIRLRADVNCRPSTLHGPPPLQLAVEKWKTDRDWAELLIRELRWAGAEMVDAGGENIAIFAFKLDKERDLECVKCLFECGAKLYPDNTTQGPLEFAVHHQHKDLLNLLLLLQADINYPNTQGITPLHLAHSCAFHKHLLSAGANVNATDVLGNTPLHATITHHRAKVSSVQLLLEATATVNARNAESLTPLHVAIRAGRQDMAQVLVKAGADVHAPTRDHWTALQLAIDQRHSHSLVTLLLDMGADPTRVLPDGRTTLHLACIHGNHHLVQILLSCGCNPNIGDRQGNTPVHVALLNVQHRVWKILLENGGDETLPNQEGHTPDVLSANNGWRRRERDNLVTSEDTDDESNDGTGTDDDDDDDIDDDDDDDDEGSGS